MEPDDIAGKRVTILGAGGIAATALRYFKAGGATVTILRRTPEPVEGADRTEPIAKLHAVLPETDVLVLALAVTPETVGIIGAAELALLPETAVLVNVARGIHVDTDALVEALQNGRLAAAGLDVTNPEPLPVGHPLWDMDNVYISSHRADSAVYVTEQSAKRASENVRRRIAGEPLIGLVDAKAGY